MGISEARHDIQALTESPLFTHVLNQAMYVPTSIQISPFSNLGDEISIGQSFQI